MGKSGKEGRAKDFQWKRKEKSSIFLLPKFKHKTKKER
jgi:hypothetical protein